jgi:integrase
MLGEVHVSDIDTALILGVLEPIWHSKTETASRVRGRVESVLDWATVRGYRNGENPARWKGHLDKLLPARAKVQKVEHHAALPYMEMSAVMRDLQRREGVSARALEFAILTVARSGEVRGAAWNEFDLEAGTWTIPAARMKAKKEHRVPLSSSALAILRELPRIDGNPYVFPAPRGGTLSDMALTAVLRRMGRGDLTQHGFRSTFRDWAGETTAFPREVIEHALAHQLRDKVEAAYQRGDLLRKRANLMEEWSHYCTAI